MIIPIRCITCSRVIADKYQLYLELVRQEKIDAGIDVHQIKYLDKHSSEKSIEGKVLDKLNITSMCCRRSIFTHVDIYT